MVESLAQNESDVAVSDSKKMLIVVAQWETAMESYWGPRHSLHVEAPSSKSSNSVYRKGFQVYQIAPALSLSPAKGLVSAQKGRLNAKGLQHVRY